MDNSFETISVLLEPTHTGENCKVVVVIYFDIAGAEEEQLIHSSNR